MRRQQQQVLASELVLVDAVLVLEPETLGDNREHLESMLRQHLETALGVPLVLGGAVHVQVIAPAGQLQAIIAPPGSLGRKLGDGNVRELSRKQRNRSGHLALRVLASLVSHRRFDTRSVIPAKAGFQATFLWIPAFAGKTIVAGQCRKIALM